MEKQKFKVGDRVRFKSWDRMVKEYGIDEDGGISLPGCFVPSMKHLCGTYATISEITNQYGDDRIFLENFTTNGDTRWAYSPEMLVRARTRKKKELPLGLEYEADDEQKEEPKANGKFKIGDRVKAIKPVGNDNMLEVCGTVVCWDGPSSCPYLVEFDKYINGHGGIRPFTGKPGFCWWCDIDDLELASEQKKKRGRPVGSKNKKKVEDDSLDAIKYAMKTQAIMLPKDNSEDILDTLKEIKGLLEKLVEQKQPTFVELLKDFLKK